MTQTVIFPLDFGFIKLIGHPVKHHDLARFDRHIMNQFQCLLRLHPRNN